LSAAKTKVGNVNHGGFRTPASESEQWPQIDRFVLSLTRTAAAAAAAAAAARAEVTLNVLLAAWSSGNAVAKAKDYFLSLQAVGLLALPKAAHAAAAAALLRSPSKTCRWPWETKTTQAMRASMLRRKIIFQKSIRPLAVGSVNETPICVSASVCASLPKGFLSANLLI
jgi:hypothetical protein